MNTRKQKLRIDSASVSISYSYSLEKFLDEIEILKQKLISQGCDPDSIMINAPNDECCSNGCGDSFTNIYLCGTRLETEGEYQKRLKIEEKYQKLFAKIKTKATKKKVIKTKKTK